MIAILECTDKNLLDLDPEANAIRWILVVVWWIRLRHVIVSSSKREVSDRLVLLLMPYVGNIGCNYFHLELIFEDMIIFMVPCRCIDDIVHLGLVWHSL